MMLGLEESLGETVADIISAKINDERKEPRSLKACISVGHRTGVKVITEIKPASPSEGILKPMGRSAILFLVKKMEEAGACAISVLVEPRHFNGSLEALELVREHTDLPIIAKGFHFEPYHLAQCRAAGADAFLLMVRVVEATGGNLTELMKIGAALGMEALVEANTKEEVDLALESGAEVVAVNNRMIYDDLQLNLGQAGLGNNLPSSVAFISASGINGPGDLKEVCRHSGGRADAVLVGSSVMKARDIGAHIRSLVKAGAEVVL